MVNRSSVDAIFKIQVYLRKLFYVLQNVLSLSRPIIQSTQWANELSKLTRKRSKEECEDEEKTYALHTHMHTRTVVYVNWIDRERVQRHRDSGAAATVAGLRACHLSEYSRV